MRIHVVGIGTGHGDDVVGLTAAEALSRRALPAGVSIHRCERPVPDLLDALEGADAAILVDAARTGAAPGSVQRLSPGDLARALRPSSHALGVADALALAEALGRAPARIEVLGVELGDAGGSARTPAVSAAAREAAETALAIATELLAPELERPDDA